MQFTFIHVGSQFKSAEQIATIFNRVTQASLRALSPHKCQYFFYVMYVSIIIYEVIVVKI